jgi:membrane protein DedA with SNARE-associated domain
MNLEYVILHFGYIAVLVGTFFEGEIILILGGFAAHRGYLDLPLVIGAAFLGSLLGDQFYFFLGRYRGRAFLEKHPDWDGRISRFRRLMDRFGTPFMIIFRFLYGLRTVAPFAIGLSDISTVKFMALNALSAAVWAVALGILGYVFGHAMEIVLDDVKKYELVVMAGLVAAAVSVFIIQRLLSKRRRGGKDGAPRPPRGA